LFSGLFSLLLGECLVMSFVSMKRPVTLAGCLVLALVFLIGCGEGTKLSQVEGTVTVDGANANSGEVIFAFGKGGQIAGQIQADGKYKVIGVPVGSAKIAVRSLQEPRGMKDGAPSMKDMPGGKDASAPPEKPVTIPDKYKGPENSGLSYTVKSGSNKHNIELKSN
jgi:hypothetical protein